MSSILDTLIIDRTEGAVYNVEDLNRVGAAVAYVAARLAAVGIVVDVAPKTDWQRTDMPTKSTIDAYRADIRAVRAAVSVSAATPAAPTDTNYLTVDDANAIERILLEVSAVLDAMRMVPYCSGASTARAGMNYYFKGA